MITSPRLSVIVVILVLVSCEKKKLGSELKSAESNGYTYEYVPDDPLKVRIGTQADKQPEAMKAMHKLMVDFPGSQKGFEMARNAMLSQIESERITKSGVLFTYEYAREQGIDYDIRKDVYEKTQTVTLDDIANFQQQYVKGKTLNVVLIGDKDKINFRGLTTIWKRARLRWMSYLVTRKSRE